MPVPSDSVLSTVCLRFIFYQYDSFGVVCEGEDVFGQLHVLVSGVDGAGDAT